MDEHQLADVVQQGGDHQAVARLVADLAGQPVGGALGGHGVQPEALGNALPDGGALEEVKGARAARDGVHVLAGEDIDGGDDALDAPPLGALHLVGETQDGDGQRHVGLDGGHDIGQRRLAVLEQAQHAVA